jgi:hypothetical protein
MTTTIAADAADRQDERKRKRGAVIKFSLAGAALLGIAAAATSAAWTDDAWFSASAQGATIELQGSLDSTPLVWDNADTTGASLVIPKFDNLVPNETRTYTVHVKNSGSVGVTVGAPTWTPSATDHAIFDAPHAATVTLSETAPFTLAPNATKDVVVTVKTTGWDNTDTAKQGATGAGSLVFTGTVGS